MQDSLMAMQDAECKAFQYKLMPTVDPDTVIGVRIAHLTAIKDILENAKENSKLIAIKHTKSKNL